MSRSLRIKKTTNTAPSGRYRLILIRRRTRDTIMVLKSHVEDFLVKEKVKPLLLKELLFEDVA